MNNVVVLSHYVFGRFITLENLTFRNSQMKCLDCSGICSNKCANNTKVIVLSLEKEENFFW